MRRSDQYNDPTFNYLNYWNGRRYEHEAESMAIKRLLRGKHFELAVDVGGGFGRLSPLLKLFANRVVLAEPSQQQLDIAKDYLKGHADIERKLMSADHLKFDNGSVDLITMVRVMHHLPDPLPELLEVSRVLSPDGLAVIEVANYSHFVNKVKYYARRQKLPTEPVDIRTGSKRTDSEIPFVNHNPETFAQQMLAAGLEPVSILSVSNLRSTSLKKLLPRTAMLTFERLMQTSLARFRFGPSIFFLVRKTRQD